MSIPETDYIGFSFNGIHSSELGIVRTSDGSRYTENLLPNLQDQAVPVPGGDGAYYFGSYYTQRQFPISFAFDSITEKQVNQLKVLLGDRKIHNLIFDENPYKIYKAKISNSAMLKFIPFAEGITNRIYKGEGNITFTVLQPFAYSPHRYLNEYKEYNIFEKIRITDNQFIPNTLFIYDEENDQYILDEEQEYDRNKIYYIRKTSEWKEASRMKEEQGELDKKVFGAEGLVIPLFNPGNIESDWILSLKFNEEGIIPECTFSVDKENFLSLRKVERQNDDVLIKINTKTGLIEGYRNSPIGEPIRSGNIYNQYMNMGTFFKIPLSFKENSPEESKVTFYFSNRSISDNMDDYPLTYTYYYF